MMRVIFAGAPEASATLFLAAMQDLSGCEGVVFTDATSVWHECLSSAPDLLLLDAPLQNSLMLLEKFHAHYAEIPVLMVLGPGEESLRLQALTAGVSDFLTSPLDQIECRLRIKNLLDLRQTRLELSRRTSWLADEVNQAFLSLELNATQAQEISEIAEANLKLEEANRNKNDFLARVSHDLRAPLATITGYSELIALEVPSHRSELSVISRNAHHLLGLIDELLEFTRNTLNLSQPHTEPVDLYELIGEVLQQAEVLADGNRVSLEVVGCLPQMLMLDEVSIKRVLSNLLSNAVKFTCNGTVQMRVRAERASPGRQALQFEVIDNGVGIAAEDQVRIFEPFYRAAQTANSVPGTGLGLAICRQLAEAMGGCITLESVPGEGSCFSLHLTCSVADTAASGREEVAPFRSVRAEPAHSAAPTQTPLAGEGGADGAMALPGEAQLEKFQHWAEQGALSRLEFEATTLAENCPEYAAFARFVLAHCLALNVEALGVYCAMHRR